jgi:hypothetical protein
MGGRRGSRAPHMKPNEQGVGETYARNIDNLAIRRDPCKFQIGKKAHRWAPSTYLVYRARHAATNNASAAANKKGEE